MHTQAVWRGGSYSLQDPGSALRWHPPTAYGIALNALLRKVGMRT